MKKTGEPFLTVFTATYNRAYILPRLYESLKNQGRTDFEWLVVDDGSTDGTQDLINSWIEEGAINIRYVYQEHGGIARAHNRAVQESCAPLFFVIASDDVLAPGGIELIYDNLSHLDGGRIQYLLFPCRRLDGAGMITFPVTGTVLSWPQFAAEYHCETAYVCRTDILREYPYPDFEGEMYVSPVYIIYLISDKYAGYMVNSPMRLIEYLPDGITCNRMPIKCANYRGWTLVKNQNLKYASGFMSLFKLAGVYDAYSILSGKRRFISSSSRPFWAFVAFPAGILYMVAVILWGRWKLSRSLP